MCLTILIIRNHLHRGIYLRLEHTPLRLHFWHGQFGHRVFEHSQVLPELEHLSARLAAYGGNCRKQAITLIVHFRPKQSSGMPRFCDCSPAGNTGNGQ